MNGSLSVFTALLLWLFASAAHAAAEHEALASELLGSPVVNAEGAPLGRLDGLMFDVRSGALRAVALASGGWLPFDGWEAAFAVSRLAPEAGGGYVLQQSARRLPPRGLVDPEWPVMRARELIGREVVDRLHRDFGEIRDLVVDVEAGRVRSALVDRRDDWAAGTALVNVPIEWFSIPRDVGETVALNYSRERFE
jgi:sporulation protein YlmC with PRC-barrel domain